MKMVYVLQINTIWLFTSLPINLGTELALCCACAIEKIKRLNSKFIQN